VSTGTVIDLFQATNRCHQRQSGFDQHPLVPSSSRTELEIAGNTLSSVETDIGQNDALLFQSRDQRQKNLVMDISRIPSPTDYLPLVVNQPAQLHAHDPAPVGFAFLADLLLAASFPDRMDQFDAIAVNDSEKARLCQNPSHQLRCVDKARCKRVRSGKPA